MSIATIVVVALIQSAPPTASPAPEPAPRESESQRVVLDRTGVPQLSDAQRREFVCPRRAPTGSRLARTWCERRVEAEARAQAARESHEAHILGTGWLDPDTAGGGVPK